MNGTNTDKSVLNFIAEKVRFGKQTLPFFFLIVLSWIIHLMLQLYVELN